MTRDDQERRIQAEVTLAHMRDQQRLIDARTPVVHETMEPIKTRGKLNGFTKEAEDFVKGK